jgi:23S rRNA (guanine745-N1)-methyltransferase
VDLSRHALKKAARRDRDTEFAVASVYHLPLGEGCVDLLLNCFAPLALEEFRRVLRPGGGFLYVVPGARHLWELKEVLYERPYENREQAIPYEGFVYRDIVPVEFSMALDAPALGDLFAMTPYCWKTPKAGVERLYTLERLDVTASFRIHVFRRT